MSGAALRHFVEEALGRHEDDFDDWFPSCFHWRGLCADTPQMVAGLTGNDFDPDELEANEAQRARAERVFRFAHVVGLALLAAGSTDDDDPGQRLEVLIDEPEEGEEAYFQSLVSEVLGPLEESIAGGETELDPRGETAYALVNAVWPAVEEFSREDGILGEETQPFPGATEAERTAVGSVLESFVLVAAMLAAFRWMSVGRA